jgi:hypothetical protein
MLEIAPRLNRRRGYRTHVEDKLDNETRAAGTRTLARTVRRVRSPVRSREDAPHLVEEGVQVQRFWNHVMCAQLARVGMRRHDQRHGAMQEIIRRGLLKHPRARSSRHRVVRQDEVVAILPNLLQPVDGVGGFVHLVPFDFKRRHQQAADVVLIFHNENARASKVLLITEFSVGM